MDTRKVTEWNYNMWNMIWEINYDLEYEMLLEELSETQLAMANNDKVEIVDWLIDIIFVAIWTLHKLWLTSDQIDKCYDLVCESNNSKWFVKNEAGKIQKWPNYHPPKIKEYLQDIWFIK